MSNRLSLSFGFSFEDLYDRDALIRIDAVFLKHLNEVQPALHNRLLAARQEPASLTPKQSSELILEIAPYLDDFIGQLFGISSELRRMYENREDLFYYLTVYNENYPHPPMPEGVEEGILKGIYLFKKSDLPKAKARVQLLGSGPMVNEARKAARILAEKYAVAADVWSVTSYNELRREALKVERWNRLHPAEPAKTPYVQQVLEGAEGPIIAASDYMKIVHDQIAPWLPGRFVSLGTDGFGRSDSRTYLRKHFEVDGAAIAAAALSRLARDGKFDAKKAQKAIADLEIDSEKADPATA